MIIESIPEKQLQTGTKLFNELIYLEKIYQTGILIEYEKVNTNNQFFDCLDKLYKDLELDRKIPLLHIEAHGGPNVLKLSSDNEIYWTELTEPFTKINIATHNNFVVVVSACFGAHVMSTIRIGELGRSPIFAAIGPLEEVKSQEIELGYQAFYHELLKTENINTDIAIDKLNERNLDNTKKFILISSQRLFYHGCSTSIREWNSIKAIGHRAQRINKLIKSEPMTKDMPEEIKNFILIDAVNQEPMPVIEKLYNQFMMIDLFPENSLRFHFDKTKITQNNQL